MSSTCLHSPGGGFHSSHLGSPSSATSRADINTPRNKFDAISGRSVQLKCAPPRGENRMQIPFDFYRIRRKARDISGRGIHRVYFCGRGRVSLSFFSFRCAGPSRRLSLSLLAASNFPNDRLTQCWKLVKETREEREKKISGLGRGGVLWRALRFSSYTWIPPIAFPRDRKINETSMRGRSSRKCKRHLSWTLTRGELLSTT